MRKGPDLLDLGEGELEGGIDPVQDLAPPHEIGAVHDPDARHRRRRHRLLPPSVASCKTNFSKRLHAKRRRWATGRLRLPLLFAKFKIPKKNPAFARRLKFRRNKKRIVQFAGKS